MIVVILVFLATLILGVPICAVLGLSGLTHIAVMGVDSYFNVVTQKVFAGMSVSSLTCIPFFIIAGELMNASGVTQKLIDLVRALVGHFRGGLAYVVVLVAMILSAILGSANAVAAILCAVIVPEMIHDGYRDDFSAALVCASGVLGPVIPPSVTFVYFSVLSGVSVTAMFMGGAIPGILIGLGYIIIIRMQTKRLDLPRSTESFNLGTLLTAFVKAIPALLVPLILVAGITLGIFTPSESGAVAVAAAIAAGLIYRKFKITMLPSVLMKSVPVTAGIFIIIGFGNIMGWTMAVDKIPEKISGAVLGFTQNGAVIIMLMFAILLVVGCSMEATAAQLIFTPVLMPLAMAAGMDPIQFGVWFCIMITIGLVTPPVGMTLFVTSNITKIPLGRISKQLLPFIAMAFIVTLMMAYIPDVIMFLPRLMGAA
ncbi:TRAP transporter large permease [uncultured Oscillibacter sp.]|uniref:TRAP transporter large permease n=1 Tax=uncultured Oscillibacter sp. TaxID=876091 RepID=UPI0025D86E00|nr:TRAP transporter large permease [uncultured Oscillibacter sp.]MCX4371485.1 TRAP transporter large permease [Dysosmobacter sp.]